MKTVVASLIILTSVVVGCGTMGVSDRRIQAGDCLKILIHAPLEETPREFRRQVDPDGYAELPYIGRVLLFEQTPDQAVKTLLTAYGACLHREMRIQVDIVN